MRIIYLLLYNYLFIVTSVDCEKWFWLKRLVQKKLKMLFGIASLSIVILQLIKYYSIYLHIAKKSLYLIFKRRSWSSLAPIE